MTREKWLFVGILLLAATFRLVALRDVPPGLSQDEVLDAGMPAFILAGNHALFFREGYGHEPLYHYWGIPFYLGLGENYLQARLASVFLGMLLVAATMRWARREFGLVTAMTAGLGLAVSWWPVIFSRIGIRPIMEPLFVVGAAWFWPKRPWLAGLLLGLSLYTYTAAQVMLAWPVLLTAVLLLTQRQQWQHALKSGAQVAGTAVLVTLPLYLTWWADPSLLQRVDQLGGPLDALRQGNTQPILAATQATLGVFSFHGDPRGTYGLPGVPLFDWLTALLFYAGLLITIWRIRLFPFALLFTWLAVGLLPSALTPQSPSTIRLVGALPAVFVMMGVAMAIIDDRLSAIGKQSSVTNHQSPITDYRLRATVYVLLLALLLFNIGRTIQYGFIRWPQTVETRLNHYQAVLLDIVRYEKSQPPGDIIIADPFFEQIDAESWQRTNVLPRTAVPPTNARWIQAGPGAAGAMVFTENGNGRLYVPEYAPLSPKLRQLLRLPDAPIYQSQQTPRFAVYDAPPLADLPLLPEPINFGEQMTLEGYEIIPPDGGPTIYLVTRWHVDQSLLPHLTAFVHLLNAQGEIVAQYDGLDAASTTLRTGDRLVQLHPLLIPPGNGPFTLQIGLYTPPNGQRLTHAGSPTDVVILATNLHFDEK
ncbi:MAG: hypothetical protein HND44_02590 [Chloroflexi bacterium]|nr:hypothetical protein [Ardenticatenaceae bacterium]MBL1127387.1 hypothetical protein [Chloroflexota bacterium]NOG33449.1 hypothetical protein [Chloroflexota bacterium]GIK58539.1 MAG: hypothetical protein BroJett015_42020 [Chloroflexota bacterium]